MIASELIPIEKVHENIMDGGIRLSNRRGHCQSWAREISVHEGDGDGRIHVTHVR